jgi:glycosyltransferase involved in cell wall biosynthesis
MGAPTVSIVIPTLGDPLLADALDSIAAQTYDAIEIVVVDGSENGISSDRRNRIDSYEYQEPRGLSAARNRGIDLASGEYVAFLDEDDLFTSESIASRVRALEDGFDVAYGDWFEVGPTFTLGDTVGPERLRTTLPVRDQARQHVHQFVEQGLRPSAVMVRRECFNTHKFDPDRRIAEDFHLWVRLAHDFHVCRIDAPVLYYRIREGTLSRTDRDAYRIEKFAAMYDLAARYPELRPHTDRVIAHEWYRHGREKLAGGDGYAALHAAARALATDPQPRAAALLATLCLPLPVASKDRFFCGLERLQEAAGRVVDTL